MGIAPYVAEAIVREHAFRKLQGDVLLLGRQTMFFTPAVALEVLRLCGVTPAAATLEGEDDTLFGRAEYISDRSFFGLLGVPQIRALDHSDYEGADLIWNLNHPVPDRMAEIADFILDGSTLDNVFNPAQALMNIARMLKPGGRLVSINAGSYHSIPYSLPTPQWFLDYFVANRFADVRTYIIAHGPDGMNVLLPDLSTLVAGGRLLEVFNTPYTLGTLTFAEKAADSTWDVLPSQQGYRPDDEWQIYLQNLARIIAHTRPELARSNAPPFVKAPKQYLFVDHEGRRRPRPATLHTLLPNRVKRWIVDRLA